MLFDLFGIAVSAVSVVLFAAGIILLLIEMFTPGFGIFGGLGLLSLVLCIVFTANSVESALLMILIIGAILVLFALLFARSLKKGFLYKSSIVLKNTSERKEGFVSNADYSRLIGRTGKSLTILRPAGLAVFDGEKVDVVTDGEFIQPGAAVEVYEVAGRRVTVRLAQDVKKDRAAGLDIAGSSLDI